MSANRYINSTVENFNGGSVRRSDLVPAIVFSVALALAAPLLIWRIVSKKHRSKVLANGVAFFLIRLASLIIRAYMSRRNYNTGTLVAQAILISIGYLPLLNAFIDLWQTRAEKGKQTADNFCHFEHAQKKVKWVRYVGWALRVLLLASLATAIAAGVYLSRNISDERQANLIRDLLKASYIVSLVVTVLSMLFQIISIFQRHESIAKNLLYYAYTIPLLIVSIYRVVEVYTGYSATTSQLAAFWAVMILFEFIAYIILLAMSIPKVLGKLSRKHEDAEKRAIRSSNSWDDRHDRT